MADNANITAGDGTIVVATDKIGGIDYQRVKATWGADGTATDTSAANPMPVVQTGALPAGTAAIGKLAANSGVDIGDVDVTSVPTDPFGATADAAVSTDAAGSINAHLRGLVKLWVAGALGVDTELAAAVAFADALSKPTTAPVEAWLVGYNGATGDMVRVQSFGVDMAAVAITTIATVWTPTSGKKFRLMGGSFSVSAACSVLFEDNSAGNGTIYRTPLLLANTPYNFDLGNGKLSATANNVLKATASTGTVTITGTLRGTEE